MTNLFKQQSNTMRAILENIATQTETKSPADEYNDGIDLNSDI